MRVSALHIRTVCVSVSMRNVNVINEYRTHSASIHLIRLEYFDKQKKTAKHCVSSAWLLILLFFTVFFSRFSQIKSMTGWFPYEFFWLYLHSFTHSTNMDYVKCVKMLGSTWYTNNLPVSECVRVCAFAIWYNLKSQLKNKRLNKMKSGNHQNEWMMHCLTFQPRND